MPWLHAYISSGYFIIPQSSERISLRLGFGELGRLTNGLVEKKGLADVLDLGDGAFQVKGLGEDNFEDLWWD